MLEGKLQVVSSQGLMKKSCYCFVIFYAWIIDGNDN